MNENWSRPDGVELEANKRALRLMRVIVWIFLALLFGTLCLWAGLFIGARVYGG